MGEPRINRAWWRALAVAARLLGGCSPRVADAEDDVPIRVRLPDGPGPFPGVVILHDCSGLGPRSSGAPRRWADRLIDLGYAVALPDSFVNRGRPGGVCTG